MLDLTHARNRMVDVQIARRGVRDNYVLGAMRLVPRETFVEPAYEEFAYEDGPLPIREGRRSRSPLMIEAGEVKPGEVVLEVGAGSGYAAAVLSRIADKVYAIERHSSLAQAARRSPKTSKNRAFPTLIRPASRSIGAWSLSVFPAKDPFGAGPSSQCLGLPLRKQVEWACGEAAR
jgi:hypothetical protein